MDACNPLLQAHPTWARDEHEGRGIPTSLTPVSGRLALPPSCSPSRSTHLGWATRRHSLVGPRTPGLETPTSIKLQRPDGRDSSQGSIHSRDTISSSPSPASGRNSRPRPIHASPEGLLKQRMHLRLARGPARAGFAEKQPWPDRYANRPYRRSIQCKDRLTPYPDARSSVDRAEVTAVTSPLH
jgi:hypothetical protein